MKLLDIKSPEFLKVLSIDELNELADDIRHYMIEVISKNGGHLSSNLSIVELTIALHATFDMPEDKIIFDTAYECYAHKILTGRAKEFATIRRCGGISGFINPSESKYDILDANLPASNLKAIEGIALASLHRDHYIIVVIDNEAIDNGDVFETLCRLSKINRKLIVIYNDTGSYNEPSHALSTMISKISNNSRYIKMKNGFDNVLSKNKSGEELLNNLNNVKHSFKEHIFNMPKLFEDLDFDYIGPVDGHDIFALLKALKKAKIEKNSCFVHVNTIKAKGLSFIENGQKLDTCICKPFDINTGKDLVDTPKTYFSFNSHLNLYLDLVMDKFKELRIITTSDIYDIGFMELYNKHKDRFILCLNNPDLALEIGRGLAKSNLLPIVLMDASEMARAYNAYTEIQKEVAKVILCVYNVGLKAFVGNDFQGVNALGMELLNHPHKVYFADEFKMLEAMMISAIHENGPTVINYSEGIFKYENNPFTIQTCTWRMDEVIDPKAYVLTYGRNVKMFREDIKLNNLKLNLVNLICLNEFDENILATIIASKKPIILYDEARDSGLSERLKAYLYEHHASNDFYTISVKDKIEIASLSVMRKQLDYTELFKELKIYD